MRRILWAPIVFSLLCLFMLPSHDVQSQETKVEIMGVSRERGEYANFCVKAYHMAMKTDGLIRIQFLFSPG